MKFQIALACLVAVSFAEETETKGGMYKPQSSSSGGYGQASYSSDYPKPSYSGASSNDYHNSGYGSQVSSYGGDYSSSSGGYGQAGSDYYKPSYSGAGSNDYHNSGYGSQVSSYGSDYNSNGAGYNSYQSGQAYSTGY